MLLYVKPRWGRAWLTAVTLGYWLLTTPAGAALLARSITSGYAPLQTSADADGAHAVVMLGGGSRNVQAEGRQLSYVSDPSALRAIETWRVYRLLGDPLVIVSGGVTDPRPGAAPESEAYQTAMRDLGVPAERVVSESESHNTHDEAVVIAACCRAPHRPVRAGDLAPAHATVAGRVRRTGPATRFRPRRRSTGMVAPAVSLAPQ